MGGRARLCAALDVASTAEAVEFARVLRDDVGYLKVGLELFVAEGPAVLAAVRDAAPRVPIFLDLKLCDIPETVARAVTSAARLGPSLLTVHASGGREMLRRAVAAAEQAGGACRILAVTVLTSLDQTDLEAQGVVVSSAGAQARRLASLAFDAGVRGFVCSAREARALRADFPEALLVTPGIRPGGAAGGEDQKRVTTPADAIAAGADLLVVGRPLRDAPAPAAAAAALVGDIDRALAAQTESGA